MNINWKPFVRSLSDENLFRLSSELHDEKLIRAPKVELSPHEKSMISAGKIVQACKEVKSRVSCDLSSAWKACKNFRDGGLG